MRRTASCHNHDQVKGLQGTDESQDDGDFEDWDDHRERNVTIRLEAFRAIDFAAS